MLEKPSSKERVLLAIVSSTALTCVVCAVDLFQQYTRAAANGTAIESPTIKACEQFTRNALALAPPEQAVAWKDFLDPDSITRWCLEQESGAEHGITCPQDSWNCTKNADPRKNAWLPIWRH